MTSETQASNFISGSYAYNADGQRVRRRTAVSGQPVVETWQVYGFDGDLLAEYAANAGSAPPQKEYGYRNGQLLVEVAAMTAGWGPPPEIHDNPLVINLTTVQARHITELRTAINALRTNMGMPNYMWQYSATTNDWISANPILEMRTALDQALGEPPGGYSPGLANGQLIKKDHIQELRDRVLNAWNSGSGGTDIRWLVADHLGTPRIIIDKTGALAKVKRHDYLPFGEELIAFQGLRTTELGYTGDNVRQKFTSKERDIETGLDYFGARYYASMQGRFTGADPYDINLERQETADPREANALFTAYIGQPQHWNHYSYALNNPLKYVDPDGLYEYEVTLLGQTVKVHIDDDIIKKKGALERIQNNLQKAFDKINAGADDLTDDQKESIHSQNRINVSNNNPNATLGDTFLITQRTAENPNIDILAADIIHDSRHSEQLKRGLSYNESTYIPMEMEASQFTVGVMDKMGGFNADARKRYEDDAKTGHFPRGSHGKDKSTPKSRAKVFDTMSKPQKHRN